MRTCGQKLKATEQTLPAKSILSGQGHFGQSPEVNPILPLRGDMGNLGGQQLARINAECLEVESSAAATTRLAHDFSRILVYSSALGNIQPKPTIHTPGVQYEQEADRVADLVTRIPDPLPQRPCGGECPGCKKEEGSQQQLQTKSVQGPGPGEATVSPVRHGVEFSGEPLDSTTSRFIESRFGHDFGAVRVYKDAQAAESAHAVKARAYTIGRSIVFGWNQYAPATTEGRRLLADELTRVVQQERDLAGLRTPTIQRTVEGDITRQSITQEWAYNLTDEELEQQIQIVRQQISLQADSYPEIEVARTNLEILESEVRWREQSLRGKVGNPQQRANPAASGADDPAFWEWWKLVVGFEGSLKDWRARPGNKRDGRGGETNYGVTEKTYMAYAAAFGLSPTEKGFDAMTPDQAMLFRRMIWKASGADKVKNTGVALVLADWYWGGIDLSRFSALLKEKGRGASFDRGMPDAATIALMNPLSPGELVELMSNAKGPSIAKSPRAIRHSRNSWRAG